MSLQRILLASVALTSIGGCALVTPGNNQEFCRIVFANLGPDMRDGITREIRHESPNGAMTKPYSRAVWDAYWNNRIFQLWNVGPSDCGGTYQGPSGRKLVHDVIARRREIGLPEITLEERNRDKGL